MATTTNKAGNAISNYFEIETLTNKGNFHV